MSGDLGKPRKRRAKRPLAMVLRERGVLSVPHAVEVALDICDLLAPAHESGVVHGQLGLGCVRLAFTPEGGPKEVEIFTLNSGADESGAVTAEPFVEPDRLGGGPFVVDARSDIWAIGALLYTMLVGKPPPASDVRLPDDAGPRSLAAFIEACLSPVRDDRPPSVDDLTEKLGSFATWPPDQFARLAQRRERRATAERVKERRERLGLGNVPGVLDKLDDAAVARAQRDATAAMSSVLHTTATTQAAMERLMTAVHEGTDAARVELAAALPPLVDFDDEDEVVLPTRTDVANETAPLAPVVSPLAVAPPDLPPALLSAPPPPEEPRPRRVGLFALVALAIVLVAGGAGYVVSATASKSAPEPATVHATATATATATPTAPPPSSTIPVFSPSSLPEVPAISPSSLPDAKRQAKR